MAQNLPRQYAIEGARWRPVEAFHITLRFIGDVAEPEHAPGAFAAERLAERIEVVIVVRQLGHMDQTVDLRVVQFHEQTETGDAADDAVELAADVLFHPRSPITFVDFALGLIGPTLTLRALQRQRGHAVRRIGKGRGLRTGQRVLDRAMDQKIGIASDR